MWFGTAGVRVEVVADVNRSVGVRYGSESCGLHRWQKNHKASKLVAVFDIALRGRCNSSFITNPQMLGDHFWIKNLLPAQER